jgi:succinate dehydrogenase/fumarate reductase cytochrome b subunit
VLDQPCSKSRTLLYPGVVAVLNPIPEWIVIFSATMVAAAFTNIKSAIRRVAKRITKGKVIKMAMKLTAALWWASACVVGMISTSPAESG